MSDDLIKRSDAIKALDNAWINGTSLLDANEAVKQLNDLPSADRPQEWIPCSERLPSEKKAVLICVSGGIRFTGKLIRTDTGYKWSIPLFAVWMDVGDGDAWMPLPEPWKGADDEAN